MDINNSSFCHLKGFSGPHYACTRTNTHPLTHMERYLGQLIDRFPSKEWKVSQGNSSVTVCQSSSLQLSIFHTHLHLPLLPLLPQCRLWSRHLHKSGRMIMRAGHLNSAGHQPAYRWLWHHPKEGEKQGRTHIRNRHIFLNSVIAKIHFLTDSPSSVHIIIN